MDNKNLPIVKPMENYEAPKVASLDEIYKNPEPLKKLPKRWAKNAAVVACVGILGMSTLAGCIFGSSPARQQHHRGGERTNGYEYNITNGYGIGYNGYEEFDLVIRIHGGGGGFASYVVHMTEQEALGIIRRQLEAAGLRFSNTPPNYIAFEDDSWMPSVGLDLFDARNNVAISHLNLNESDIPFGPWGSDAAQSFREAFESQTDITVGVFYTSVVHTGWDAMGDWIEDEEGEWVHVPARQPTARQRAEAKAEARPILEERLNDQIQEFIDFLRSERIIR